MLTAMGQPLARLLIATLAMLSLCQCVNSRGRLMGGPTLEQRELAIATEEQGDFYYGRRYYVEKTRFWGYLREPRTPWRSAKLVMMREDLCRVPDRLPEEGPPGQRYGFDQNHEYRVRGHFSGRKAYDPNSNQILPEFIPTSFELINPDPGWLFQPDDRYHPKRINLLPR
ncbi:MAG TPA: hypothetical protein VFY13_03075 [Luteolibacter sp.]|nr:hypothetical protein [Luteolibacter sp.]